MGEGGLSAGLRAGFVDISRVLSLFGCDILVSMEERFQLCATYSAAVACHTVAPLCAITAIVDSSSDGV